MTSVVKLQQVSKRFGQTLAMNRISLDVPSGIVFALLGENGAGKTTTIRTLLGLERPNTGQIAVLGMDPIRDGIEIRRRIGYLPESPALYHWMTVSEIGWFAAGFYPEGYMSQFEFLANEFELPLKKKIKTLSKGGRAKVGLALAMVHRPELLILDEPTSGLDTMVRRKFLESMVDVAAEGRTVLLSSHQIPEVERVADHVAIINRGRVLVNQPLDSLKQQVERWIVTLEEGSTALPAIGGAIISHEGIGSRRQQLVVRHPANDDLWKLRDHPGIAEVELYTPSLEEIFVAFMQADPDTIARSEALTARAPMGRQPEQEAPYE